MKCNGKRLCVALKSNGAFSLHRALDGKHVTINSPRHSGSYFFNYKGAHSIVLLALVDSNYRFVFVDIGCNGRVSDGGVFGSTSLATGIRNKNLVFPSPRPLPDRQVAVPYTGA